MTLIVGLERNGIAYIGGESGAISGEVRQRIDKPKVMRVGAYIMGYSHTFRFGDLLRYQFAPPAPPPLPFTHDPEILDRFMVTQFAPELRKCQKENGAMCKDDKGHDEYGIALIGIQGRVYEFERGGQIIGTGEGYAATGSAYAVALGALYVAVEIEETPPMDVLALALEAGIHHHGETLGPFLIMGTDGSEFLMNYPHAPIPVL